MPCITIKLTDVRVYEGQPLKLECKIDGDPLPEITWYKDGEKVVPSDNLKLERRSDGTAYLFIPKCKLDDEGMYRVIATNPYGTAYDKCTAIVKKAKLDIDQQLTLDSFDGKRAPKVLTPLENIRVPEKEPFTLLCKFSGEPKLAIKWFKDGERVYEYNNCKLKETLDDEENLICQLIVDSSTKTNGGSYRCIAENIYGTARTVGEVNIQCKLFNNYTYMYHLTCYLILFFLFIIKI